MAASHPGGSNTFIASFEASGQLMYGYSRNVSKFAINRYCKIVPVKKDIGYYLRFNHEMAARTGEVRQWRDGQEAPTFNINEAFEFKPYITQRYVSGFAIGQKSVKQADWPILALNSAAVAQQHMTHRTELVATELTTTANWTADGLTHTGTASGISAIGGTWEGSSATNKYVRKSFDYVNNLIRVDTNAAVDPFESLHCIFNPYTAIKAAQTEEFRDYLKSSPFALAEVRRDEKSQNGKWGLPSQLFGTAIEIEDAVKVTSALGATSVTRADVFPNGSAVFCSRPGALEGQEGMPDFSTMQIFAYEDMTVESKEDPDNRRSVGRVVNDIQAKLVTVASGFLLTGLTA